MQILQILRDLDELRMKNIGTFPPTRVVLSSYPRADLLIGRQRPSLKLEAGLPVGLQHDSLIHRFTAAKWVSISIELLYGSDPIIAYDIIEAFCLTSIDGLSIEC